jgi:hypothetical protein
MAAPPVRGPMPPSLKVPEAEELVPEAGVEALAAGVEALAAGVEVVVVVEPLELLEQPASRPRHMAPVSILARNFFMIIPPKIVGRVGQERPGGPKPTALTAGSRCGYYRDRRTKKNINHVTIMKEKARKRKQVCKIKDRNKMLQENSAIFTEKSAHLFQDGRFKIANRELYLAALAALIASISMGVTLNRSPQMP